MTTLKLEVIAPANEPVIITHRFIKAPPELLFAAWTAPEHTKKWLGPRELEMISCEIDLRVGGSYRYVHRAPDGKEYGLHGITWRSTGRTGWSAPSSSSSGRRARRWTR